LYFIFLFLAQIASAAAREKPAGLRYFCQWTLHILSLRLLLADWKG